MSLFRKPKRIQRRVFCVDDDDDCEPEPPPPPVISHGRKENKPAKSTPLLSFADEEEDGEVFIVKKSSQSKRLAKRRDREKRRANDTDVNKYENHSNEEKESTFNTDKEEEEEKSKSKKKKVSLEGLILSGREALAADGSGDVSGSEDSGPEPAEDNRGFHQYRAESVRAALAVAPGHIPDAALIHAARKTRQQAREHGDFIPVPSEAPPGSRLQGDDGSGDDDDEGRVHVRGLDLPSDKPQRGTAAASADSEGDSEGEQWAAQQLHKARGALPDGADAGGELNPFAVAPPPPRLHDAPAHLRPLATPERPHPATAAALLAALADRLQELETSREATVAKKESWQARLAAAAAAREARAARTGALDAAYRRAQAARGFLTDLIECLDEKVPQLEALEARALALHRRRCEFLTERRRADVQDQALDTLAAGRASASKGIESEEKIRRTAEREGRRRARRLQREAAAAAAGAPPPRSHRDGDSSDDDLPPNEEHYYRQEKESIRAAAAAVFSDALPAWRSARGVCARLARWRRRDPALYNDAYVADCLPKLLAPYVRHQLILWNPLADEDNEDYERMDWYKCLMMYGVRHEKLSSESEQSSDSESGAAAAAAAAAVSEASVRADPDLMLVPAVVAGVVLPKLTELVEAAWDPVCVRACVRLRQLLVRACGVPACRAAVARVASAARARLQRALNSDVFLPPLPHNQATEGASGAFWRRCLGSGVRLLRAALALTAPPALLHADDVAISLIETLSMAAGAAAGGAAAAAAAALADTLPRSGELRARALRRLGQLATLALSRLDQANPLHIKAVEQAKAVIAEARAAE